MNNLEIQSVNLDINEDIINSLKTEIYKRSKFEYNSNVVTIPNYFYRFIGIKNNEKDYYENLHSLDSELKKIGSCYIRFGEGLDKDISIRLQNVLNDIWIKVFKREVLDVSLIINLISDNGLFPNLSNKVLLRQIKNNLKGLIEYYIKSNEIIDNHKIKVIINYVIHWINIYSKELFEEFDYMKINPKVVFYGEISREEVFYLILLSTLGCDILYFNPKNAGAFHEIDKYNAFSNEIVYNCNYEIKPFPSNIEDRIKTTAYNAKEELNKTLYTDDSGFYRPWQFSDYNVEAVTLNTTYEEIYIWIKEKAYIREGFKVKDSTVVVPNMFSKICGTHENIDIYWKEINEVSTGKFTKFYNELPIMDVVHLEYGKFNKIYPSNIFSGFNVSEMLNSSWWKYKELRSGLQKTMAEKIKDLCLNPVIINVEQEDLRDLQVDIFSVLINLDTTLLELLQAYDYPEEVPKIVVYNNEENGNLSFEDCIMLAFMNSMGIDIIIYNPSGYNDIENFIFPEKYDIHRLENVSFKLHFKKHVEKKKGFFENLFRS
ncbi:YceG family protein [Clostridium sp. CF011]|uniref:YceG family protein n=1 Tax=Clostridium sp. CF011 TaxID=2843318 RepID=UPI001C0B3A83|nr:YceG family protein [Clostridium sp. CF011]MBU3090953.1 YceG family protein [Clostridium sp. CF011]WAG69717.1 YceG family protein [Clostridium sp. CF011]